MPSRVTIRQESADRLAGGLVVSTATGGSTATLLDSEVLLDAGESPDRYAGSWLHPTSGTNAGKIRRVNSYVPSAGSIAFPALASAILAGVSYELHDHLSPAQWNTAINRGLRRCTHERRDPLAIVSKKRQYDLTTALPTLEHKAAIKALWARWGPTNEKREEELAPASWKLYHEGGKVILYLRSPLEPDPTNNLELLVEWIGPYDPLATDAAVTACPLDWIVAATLVEAWERYGRTISEQARQATVISAQQAEAELTERTGQFGPNAARPLGRLEW